MVVICLPTASLTSTLHERVATPSMWTVQAPHWAMPQPYLVPVRPTFSRIAHNSGVEGSTSTSCAVPLMVRRAIPVLPDDAPRPPIPAGRRVIYAASADCVLGGRQALWRHPTPPGPREKSRLGDQRGVIAAVRVAPAQQIGRYELARAYGDYPTAADRGAAHEHPSRGEPRALPPAR